MNKILIPTDGTNATKRAAEFVLEQSEAFDSEVHILCVQEMTGPQGGVTGPRVYNPEKQEVIDEYIALVEDELSFDTDVVKETRKGMSVDNEIIDYAGQNDIDHIVMGTTGKTRATRILVGNVAEKVSRKSECPVTTVKSDSVEED